MVQFHKCFGRLQNEVKGSAQIGIANAYRISNLQNVTKMVSLDDLAEPIPLKIDLQNLEFVQ